MGIQAGYGPTLVLMGKPPEAGRVKTRLGRDIGRAAATSFYRLSVGRLLHRLSADPRWRMVLAANAQAGARFGCWPEHVRRVPQGQGDLGDRMSYVLDTAPAGPVVIIGTDSPQVEPNHIQRAFSALSHHDAVFGPADDGGYWLIGLARRRPAPRLFEGVRWSTETTLSDTEASLPKGFTAARLEVLTDVDTGEDRARLAAEWGDVRFGPWQRR